MKNKPNPVSSYEHVVENIKNFNEGLSQGNGLETLPSYFRAWYYAPEADAVGPSKFIGYEGITVSEYMSRNDLDGRETEPVLLRWFGVLEDGTPEYQYVEEKVRKLVASTGKRVNSIARFCAPINWRVSSLSDSRGGSGRPPTLIKMEEGGSSESDAVVDIFVRAFNTLRPSEQAALLKRIRS